MSLTRHLWKNKRFTKLLARNFLLWSSVFVLLVVGMMLLSHWNSIQTVQEQLGESNQIALDQQISDMEKEIRSIRMMMIRLIGKDDVGKYFRLEPTDRSSYEDIQLRWRICEDLLHQTGFDSNIHTIYVYNELLGEVISSDESMQKKALMHDTSWFSAYDKIKNGERVEIFVRSMDERYTYKRVLTIMQSYPLLITGKRQGAIITNIDMQKYFDNMMLDRPYLVTDKNGNVICCNDLPDEIMDEGSVAWQTTGSRMITLNDRKVLITAQQSLAHEWWFYSIDLLESYNNRIEAFDRIMFVLIIVAIFLVVIFSYLLSVRMFVPVKHIMHLLDEQENELVIPADEHHGRSSELAFLAKAVMHTLDRNRELSGILEEKLKRLNQVRLRMLQSQVNPHFLYNVLASINWMVLEKIPDDTEVSDAICSLSELLRERLRHTGIISLEDELQQVKRYLNLQKLSFGNRVELSDSIDKEALEAAVPAMVLQLLVENAIKHGLDREGEQILHIAITVWIMGENLHLRVKDDGIGMQQGELESLRHMLESENIEPGRSIGLHNVYQQLHLLFGDETFIALDSTIGEGFKVEIVIPKIKISDTIKA